MKQPRSPLAHLEDELRDLASAGLLRTRRPAGRGGLSFCSNDYLGLASAPCPQAAAGASGSRLISGDHVEHAQLEKEVAGWLGLEAALVFTSGYAANVGLVSALARPGDRIVSDALNHASLVDGARLSRAEIVVVPHLDVGAVERALQARTEGRCWVITESYFSMDADAPDLRRLRAVCDAQGAALLVDEAHALGVLGPEGRGLCAELGVVPDALVGTFGKAFGTGGAFIAGSEVLVRWLWNRARSFVFSTGLSPTVAAAARANIRHARATPGLRETALAHAQQLRDGLRHLGVEALGFGHVVPWRLGKAEDAQRIARGLSELGYGVVAIRPPTVPRDTSRLRMATTAAHTAADVTGLVAAIREVL